MFLPHKLCHCAALLEIFLALHEVLAVREFVGVMQGAPVIYKPRAKYGSMHPKCFGYPPFQLFQFGVVICNLEMSLRQMSSVGDEWQPQSSRSSHGFSQRTRVGRQIFHSVASGVCFLGPRLLKCMFSGTCFFFFFSQSTHMAATKLIAREMSARSGTITKVFQEVWACDCTNLG